MAQKVKQATSPKEKRMAKAVRLHYMQDMDYEQISNELGLSYSTVRKYFQNDQIQQLKRHFSDKQLYELQRTVEQQVADAEAIAHECVGEAKRLADSSRAYNKTAKTAMEIPEKKINLLQELGVIQKPKERKEVEQKDSGESVSFEMRYTEQQEQQEEVKEDG